MSFDGRLTRLEQGFGGPPGERLVTRVVIVEDPHDRLDGAELDEFLQTIAPDGTARVPVSQTTAGVRRARISPSAETGGNTLV
jgi:hypothetical protein